MPTPEQQRRDRVETLFKHFTTTRKRNRNRALASLDTITRKALQLWPYLTQKTARSYAQSVQPMLKKARREAAKQQENKPNERN